MLRTHTCGQLTEEDTGKEVILCGWVHRRRDHGKIVFIDLRDRYGVTQVVLLPSNKAAYGKIKDISNEFVLRIKGNVNKRPKGTENPKIVTGLVELEAKEVEVLNKSKALPYEIGNAENVSEEFSLKYRFLDLRDPEMQGNFILRHKINKVIHSFFDSQGFLEVETPFLTKSTPEGARDFLVPSRLNAGKFYALPQSPQLFKQILMVSGFDRYYQIARCFRDEDLRKDRQPEFTQLDFEMSFIQEEDVFSVVEEFFKELFHKIKGVKLQIPFRRVSYQEALQKYKTDKPDLRKDTGEEFAFAWLIDFPLFAFNEEEKRWDSEHHPFTSPHPDDIELLQKGDLSTIRARSYDLVLNGVELGSGSIRIHDPELQSKMFEILNIPREVYQERFGFLLEALDFGAPVHGGFALGLDRLCAILMGKDTIRDVIGFPKTQKGVCPLTGAPARIDTKQLRELNIIVEEEE